MVSFPLPRQARIETHLAALCKCDRGPQGKCASHMQARALGGVLELAVARIRHMQALKFQVRIRSHMDGICQQPKIQHR